MTIQYPYIDTNTHFPAIAAIYDAKVGEYNAKVAIARDSGDKTRQFLKSAHRELYFELIRMMKGELAKNLFLFRDTPSLLKYELFSSLILMTNRKRLSSRTKKSEVTIYRLIERLIDAGIIAQKINHGTQRDYELHLNTEMVPISDYRNEGFNPLHFILKNGVDSTIAETLRSICTPCSSIKNSFNNKIITENNQEHEAVSAALTLNNEQTRTFNGNTGDPGQEGAGPFVPEKSKINISANKSVFVNAFGVEIEVNNKAKINISEDYAAKIERVRQKEEERLRNYSIMLVEFAISTLWPEKLIYKAEREKAYRVSEHYFKKFNTATDCEKALGVYRERIRMVQRYLERNKDFDFSNIFPAHWFDPENFSSGFVMTSKWLKKHMEYRELQQKTRRLQTEEAIVNYALKRMMKWKNPSSFQYWRSYVINKAPGRVSDYETRAMAMIKN